MDRQRRRRGRPATGRYVDSLEAQKLKRREWSGCRNPVWLTRYVHQTWKIGKGISLFKIDNDFAAHLLSLEMAKVTNWLWMNSRGFSGFQSHCLFIWKSTVKTENSTDKQHQTSAFCFEWKKLYNTETRSE